MKRRVSLFLVMLTLILFVSCSADIETVTQNPGKYVYALGELIEIYDVETGDEIATLTIDDCTVLNDKPVAVSEYSVSENKDIEVQYDCLLFVEYSFANVDGYKKKISGNNFKAYTEDGTSLNVSPKMISAGYESYISSENGFLISSPSADVTLEFTYDVYQDRHTAKIALDKRYTGESVETKNDTIENTTQVNDDNTSEEENQNRKLVFYRILTTALLILATVFIVLYVCERGKIKRTNNK